MDCTWSFIGTAIYFCTLCLLFAQILFVVFVPKHCVVVPVIFFVPLYRLPCEVMDYDPEEEKYIVAFYSEAELRANPDMADILSDLEAQLKAVISTGMDARVPLPYCRIYPSSFLQMTCTIRLRDAFFYPSE